MNNVLDLIDQSAFLAERATEATNLLQCVWVYNHAIDIDGLRQFHQHLQQGRLSRRIERSPLPFGRHRWVAPSGQSDLEIGATPRPREEFDAWLSEQANTPLDAEHGPGWHLAVLPFTDGGAGLSFVISHSLVDGVGLCEALADAASGRHDPISWPTAGSRRRSRALREDARQTARTSRGWARRRRWQRTTRGIGGPSRPASGTGRRDGFATSAVPVNERTADDTRANAITSVGITVDPEPAATNLREIRAAIKQALIRYQEVPDERLAALPLAPLLPQWLVRRMVSVAVGGATASGSSNLGAVNPAANRPDGTDAAYFAMKSLVSGAGTTVATIHRTGGLLGLLSGRTKGQVFVSVAAYRLDRPYSNDDLRNDLSSILNDFSVTAKEGWPCPEPAGGPDKRQ